MKALITGASSGIGRDMAYYLASLNCDLILVARRKERLEEIKNNVSVNVKVIAMDLLAAENVFKLYEEVKTEDIDILINNAGFGLFGDFVKTDLKRELEMIDLNIKAYHILTKLFLQDFVKKDSGYILNVASSAGFLAGPRLNTYYATKNYVAKLTMAIYEELRHQKSNVHISVLCPGPVDTEFNKVAHGVFSLKEKNSQDVAKYAITKMFKNKLIIVPGFSVKLGLFFNRFIPWKLSLKITYHIQKRKYPAS
jgi:hypothetical protein